MTIFDVDTLDVVESSIVVTPENVKLVRSGVRVMSYRVGLMVRGRRTRPAALLVVDDDDDDDDAMMIGLLLLLLFRYRDRRRYDMVSTAGLVRNNII